MALALGRMGSRFMAEKSTVEEIRCRFDADVERFSQLEIGQSATIDSPLAMNLVAQAAAATTPTAIDLLDLGCGAGNYTLKLLQLLPKLNVMLVDLSQPMLIRATERVTAAGAQSVRTWQGDLRRLTLEPASFDIILAAAVLHHLREPEEWRAALANFHAALRPGGSIWIFDMVSSGLPLIDRLMKEKYGDYLTGLKGESYRDEVFAYIEREDTPRPLLFQLDLLRDVGFTGIDILHKNLNFAAFGAVK